MNKTTVGSATSGAGGGKVQFNEFTIRKSADGASAFFFKNCAAGAHYKLVTLAIRRTGDAAHPGTPFLVFSFATVFCTKIDWAGPGDEGPEESITFAYGALDVAHAQQKPDGTLESLKSTSWSQVTNKAEFAAGVTPVRSFG